MDRRTFLKAAAGAGVGAVALPRAAEALLGAGPPARTPVEHVVVLMMENRSVDHYLGWYHAENPDFDSTQHGSYPDRRYPGAPMVSTEDWGAAGRNNFHGRHQTDPGHGWDSGRVQRNGGAVDGFLSPGSGNDEFALSYYGAADIPVWAELVRGWQTYDRWFCSLLASTYPNRYYMHSAQSGGIINNDFPPELIATNPEWAAGWNWPTIWTLLDRAGVSGGYYFANLPAIALWGPRHVDKVRHVAQFFLDCELGTLPSVSFVDPFFVAPNGLANDDHPHADIRLGQQFLSDVVEAFTSSAHYRNGALVITYDEWGGFWDHVVPPQLPDDRATPDDPGGDGDFGQVGFRIPSTIVSPWTRGNRVDHTMYDHASTLKFISQNWGLPYLNARHYGTNSIMGAFQGFANYEPEVDFSRYAAPLGLLLEPTLESLLGGEVPDLLPLSAPAPSSDLFRLADTGWFDALGLRTDYLIEDSFLRTPTALLAEVRRNIAVLTGLGL
jgi:phospholipase C